MAFLNPPLGKFRNLSRNGGASIVTKNFGQDFDLDHPGRQAQPRSAVARVAPKLIDFLMPLIISGLALSIGYFGFGG